MITKDMRIQKIIRSYPQTIPVFYEHDLQACFGCLQAKFETLEQASALHMFDLDEMLKDLNDAIEQQEQSNSSINEQ